jgi:hypothetical protein
MVDGLKWRKKFTFMLQFGQVSGTVVSQMSANWLLISLRTRLTRGLLSGSGLDNRLLFSCANIGTHTDHVCFRSRVQLLYAQYCHMYAHLCLMLHSAAKFYPNRDFAARLKETTSIRTTVNTRSWEIAMTCFKRFTCSKWKTPSPKTEEVNEGWKNLHSEELHN